MADLVQKWSEEKIPQYEQLIRVGIFSEEEIKAIIKKTTSLEYKLVRKIKAKEDYLSYIQYNIHVLALIKKRRKRINYFFKKDEIEFAIVSRIHRLFKQCTFRWPEDVKLWSSHIEFCKQWNKKIQLSKIWTSMLQFHGNVNIDLWVMAAKWEYEDNHSVDNARQIFLRGIRHFPDDPKLWQEYFKMELIHVMKTRQRLALLKDDDEESVTEEYLKGEVARVVYRNAVDALPKDSRIKCGFLEIAVPFASFAGEIINMIIEDLFQNHEKDAVARCAIAKLHLSPTMVNLGQSGSAVARAADVWAAEKRCWEDFEVAVEELDSSEMWQEYIAFLSSRVDLCSGGKDVLSFDSSPTEVYAGERTSKLFSVLEKGHKMKKLSSISYLEYVKRLVRAEKLDEAVVLLKDCSKLVDCVLLRLKLLELASQKDIAVGMDIVQPIIETLLAGVTSMEGEQEKCFWSCWSEYGKKIKSLDFLREGLKEARKRHVRLMVNFAIAYLDLEIDSNGVERAFSIYMDKLRVACPNSIELFNEMIRHLKKELPTEHNTLITCFENSIEYFGKSSPDFWLCYIEDILEVDPARVGSIHWKAMKTLDSDLVREFSEGYAILQAKRGVDK